MPPGTEYGNTENVAFGNGFTKVEGVQEFPASINGEKVGEVTHCPVTYDHNHQPAPEKYVVNTTDVQNAHLESLERARVVIDAHVREKLALTPEARALVKWRPMTKEDPVKVGQTVLVRRRGTHLMFGLSDGIMPDKAKGVSRTTGLVTRVEMPDGKIIEAKDVTGISRPPEGVDAAMLDRLGLQKGTNTGNFVAKLLDELAEGGKIAPEGGEDARAPIHEEGAGVLEGVSPQVGEGDAEGGHPEQRAQQASHRAAKRVGDLMLKGFQKHEAEEIVLPEEILFPPEE